MASASSPSRGATASSISSAGLASTTASTPRTSTALSQGSVAPSSSREGLRDLFGKRIATLIYLKGVTSGRQHHAGVVLITHKDLQTVFEAERMRKRSYRHLALGLALSPILEFSPLPDFAKAVLSALTDVESLPETAGGSVGGSGPASSGSTLMAGFGSGEKRGMRNLFSNKLKTQKRVGTFSDIYPPEGMSINSVSSGGASGHGSSSSSGLIDSNTFMGSNLPFTLDFFQTFYTLCDILIEVYSKLVAFLGATFLATSQTASSQAPTCGPHSAPTGAGLLHSDGAEVGGPGMTTPAGNGSLTPQLAETLLRLDGKIKKILAQVMKELDAVARHIAKEELTLIEASVSGNAPVPSRDGISYPNPHTVANGAGASVTGEAKSTSQANAALGPPSPYTGLPGPPISSNSEG